MKKILFILALIVSTMSFGQLTETKKPEITTIAKSPQWWDLIMMVTEEDTAYCLSYIDQRYPNLRPTSIMCFVSKQEVIDLFDGVIRCTEDKTLVLTGTQFELRKTFGGVRMGNKDGSYTIINVTNAKKVIAYFEK